MSVLVSHFYFTNSLLTACLQCSCQIEEGIVEIKVSLYTVHEDYLHNFCEHIQCDTMDILNHAHQMNLEFYILSIVNCLMSVLKSILKIDISISIEMSIWHYPMKVHLKQEYGHTAHLAYGR